MARQQDLNKGPGFSRNRPLKDIDQLERDKPKAPLTYLENIDIFHLSKMIAEKKPLQILDVREDHEKDLYGAFVVKDYSVRSMTLEDLQYGVHFNSFDEEVPIICVCSEGLRAGRAAQYLRSNDFIA